MNYLIFDKINMLKLMLIQKMYTRLIKKEYKIYLIY